MPEKPLKERPGLQRITYSAIFDLGCDKKLIKQMSERALQQKDANVNKSFEFLVGKTAHTSLFRGHKPISVMIEGRSRKKFAKIKNNRDVSALTVEIFKTFPVLERQEITQSSEWVVSVHKIRSCVLFAIADEISLHVDACFGKKTTPCAQFDTKKKADGLVLVTGDFVSLAISAQKCIS